jgi:hypothetical protein
MQKGSPLGWAPHTVREFSAGLEKQFDIDGSSLAVPITRWVRLAGISTVAGIEITLTVSVLEVLSPLCPPARFGAIYEPPQTRSLRQLVGRLHVLIPANRTHRVIGTARDEPSGLAAIWPLYPA